MALCFLVAGSDVRTLAIDEIHSTDQGQSLSKSLEHEGIDRTYHVHLPPDFRKDGAAPLVLALHGGGGQGRGFDRATRGTLSVAADKRGVVLVFPDGMNRQWCDGRTEMLKTKKVYDDVGFIAKIIDAMVEDYGVDPKRVYATGISNGGFMSVRLAIDLSNKIAAVAPVAAQLSVALKDKKPKRPISIMIINGTKDPIVPFDGGHIRLFKFGRSRGEILSTAATIDHFRRQNGCDKTPKRTLLDDKDPNDGTTVEAEKYSGGRSGTEVILVRVVGGGHTWPGGKPYLRPRIIGAVCRDIDASEMILDFFMSHSR